MPKPIRQVAPIIALALMAGAVALGVIAFLIYTGSIPGPRMAAYVVGTAAILDLLLAVAFFRMGQSS